MFETSVRGRNKRVGWKEQPLAMAFIQISLDLDKERVATTTGTKFNSNPYRLSIICPSSSNILSNQELRVPN